jgi:hypothetical protein
VAQLDDLARALQVLLNKANNAERQLAAPGRHVPRNDDSLAEFNARNLKPVGDAAAVLLKELRIYERKYASHIEGPRSLIDIDRFSDQLIELSFFGQEPSKPEAGRPRSSRTATAMAFFLEVRRLMRELGLKRRLAISNPDSVPVIVSAAAISWAFDSPLTPSGFVTAMRGRVRTKEKKTTVQIARYLDSSRPK